MGSLPNTEQQIRNLTANMLTLLDDPNHDYHIDVVRQCVSHMSKLVAEMSGAASSDRSSDAARLQPAQGQSRALG